MNSQIARILAVAAAAAFFCLGGSAHAQVTPSLRGGGADAVAATTTTVEDGNRKLACSITKPSDCVPKVPKIPTPKIPGVDTGKCKTDEMKRDWEEGGWEAAYLKRLWDTKGAAMTIALFFPATTVAAATAWKEELEQQIASFQHALAQIGADVQGEVQNRVISALQNFMQTGNLDITIKGLDLKGALKHVTCTTVGGLPAEGYHQVVLGWRFSSQ